MAIPTSTSNGSGSGTSNTGTALTAVTIAANDIVVVRIVETDASLRTVTLSDDKSLTWTKQQEASNSRKSWVFTAPTGSNTGSLTITPTFSGTATWAARVDVIDDTDGGAAVDVSDQFTQTATSCFAAPSTAIDTAANVLCLNVYACATTRTWTKDAAWTLDASGSGYLFASFSSATALTDQRGPATQSSTAVASAAAIISIKGASGGTSISVTDTGSASDSTSCTASVPVSDSGSGTDSISCAVSLTIADSGSGADTLNIAALLSAITDSGVGSDVIAQITQGVFVSLTDSGSASDSVSGLAVALSIPDTSAGVDSLAALNAVVGAIVDSCSGVDGVTVTAAGGSRVATITFSARAKSSVFAPVGKSTGFDPNL